MEKAALAADLDVNTNNGPAPEGHKEAPAAARTVLELIEAIVMAHANQFAELLGRGFLRNWLAEHVKG